MANQGVEVKGLRELVKSFEAIGIEVNDLKGVFEAIGKVVATDAMRIAPHGTGGLANSIRAAKAKNKASVRAGSAKVPYAGPIAYGWPRRGIRPSLFLQKAIAGNEDKAIELMTAGLDEVFNKHIGGT